MVISWVKFQLHNLRFYILLSTILLVILIVNYIRGTSSSDEIANIRITEYFGLLSVLYLYIALLAAPIAILFPFVPYKNKLVHARRAIGVSSFLFAYIHGNTAFLSLLGGFEGIKLLEPLYLFAITLGSVSLWILTAMAATSFDIAIKFLSVKWWKRLQRLVYFVLFAIMGHAILLGHHFSDFSSPVVYVYNFIFSSILILHALVIEKRSEKLRRLHIPLIFAFLAISLIIAYYIRIKLLY